MSARPPGRARRRRGEVGEEDKRLWDEVAREITPLPGRAPPPPAEPVPAARKAPPQPAASSPKQPPTPAATPSIPRPGAPVRRPAVVGWPGGSDAPRPVGTPEPGLDSGTARRLKRGLRVPDARIDLHGMTAPRAHAALDRFVADSVARDLRCILVITGKGGPSRGGEEAPWMHRRQGVLREEAPRWLRAGPAAASVIGIYEAHPRHGGGGAFYVYLKRRRRDGGPGEP